MEEKKYSDFGKIIVKKLRDENYDFFLNSLKYAKSISLEDYNKIPKNKNIDKELQRNADDTFKFLNSLNDFQVEQIKKIILKTLDQAAFNLLREVEENYIDNNSIGLTFKGEDVKELYNQLLSGTFFGEYFLWLELFSLFGKFQH